MKKPEKAYAALHEEWPVEIASLVEGVLWSKVRSRTIEDIVQETAALMKKAESAYAGVQRVRKRQARTQT